jgi:hypothetical protein
MSTAEYITTFASIVVGLAFADLLMSFHRLVRARRTVQWDWLAVASALLVVLTIVQAWWRFFAVWTAQPTFSFGQFLPDLLSLTLLFFLAAASLPDEVPSSGVDLREYYDENRPYFWGLFAAYVLVVTLNRIGRQLNLDVSSVDVARINTINLISIGLMSILIFTKRRWVHGAVLLVFLAFLSTTWIRLTIAG